MGEMSEYLARRAASQTLRVLAPLDWRAPGVAVEAGRHYIDFASNDYLGLSTHPALVAAAQDALQRYGVGAGASRLMSGDLALFHELESAVAAFKGTEAALVFNAGYQANAGLLPALVDRHDAIFADALAHASLLDGAVLSRAKLFRFRHNDTAHLAELLARARGDYPRALIVTESIFSMDGDRAPLADLVALKERYACRLFVDEAHATGVFGRGCVAEDGLTARVEFIMGTFSKALGSFGAYLACTRLTRDYLVNAARSFIYTTALPPATIAANLAALHLCQAEPERGLALRARAATFRAVLRAQGWTVSGASHIVPVLIGDSASALGYADALKARGFRVVAIRPPTVPAGAARLRFSLSAAHTAEQLRAVTEAMHELR
jgi:glycine C-acetyltransferase/8-amino-7-oxononanoate synthase